MSKQKCFLICEKILIFFRRALALIDENYEKNLFKSEFTNKKSSSIYCGLFYNFLCLLHAIQGQRSDQFKRMRKALQSV
jgi:hypothetical protein